MRTALLRTSAVLLCVALLVGAAAAAPLVLRRIDAFNVRSVEVNGARHLGAHDAVAASGITRASNVFDDPAAWHEALLRQPLVASVRIERRAPHTIVLHISEAVPVAYARTPELRAIDENARVLPLNTTDDELDLPVLTVQSHISAQGRAADEATRRIAAFLGAALRAEPGLLGWVSEIGVHGDAIRLVLRSATDAEVLVPAQPQAARLAELHYTLADLATPRLATVAVEGALASVLDPDADTHMTGSAPATELSRVRRIDVRFHDQIVVAMHGGNN